MMPTRRDVLRLCSLAAAAGCSLRLPASSFFPANEDLLYGVQLYTVRKEARADFAGLLQNLRQIGFTQIELHPLIFTQPAATLRKMIADAGLALPSTHMSAADLDNKIDYAHELGVQYVVTMLPNPRPVSLDDYGVVAGRFNKWGAALRDHGMQLAYLCHSHEFLPQGGSSGFEQIVRNTDPALVKLEIDLYWIVQAGVDPAAFLREHHDRIRLLHVKDRIAAPTSYVEDVSAEHFIEMGRGTIPWRSLLTQARRQGIRYVFLDQDKTEMPVLDSLRQSFSYLQTLNL
jgi:sugar phosphate isomerase/epimerase